MPERFKHFTNSLGRTYCTLRYHENLKALSIIWKGTAPENAIANLKKEIWEMIKEYRALYILNDLDEFFGDSANNLVELLKEDWNKEVFDLGIRQIVHVVKPGSEYAGKYLNKEWPGDRLKFFDNKMDAVVYLTEKQENNPT